LRNDSDEVRADGSWIRWISASQRGCGNRKLFDGATILAGGFGTCGIPENLIAAVRRKGTKKSDLRVEHAAPSTPGWTAFAIASDKKMIASYVGEINYLNSRCSMVKVRGRTDPQGTLAERLRAAGAEFRRFTRRLRGNDDRRGKRMSANSMGASCDEHGLRGEFRVHQGLEGRSLGNRFSHTARNLSGNGDGGDYVIAEVERNCGTRSLPPENVHTPGIL